MPFTLRSFFSTAPIALCVHDEFLACAYSDKKGKLECKEIELPKGIVVSGIVKDIARFREAMEELLPRNGRPEGRPATRDIYLVVPDIYIYTHVFAVPRVPPKELPLLLQKNISDFFPLASSELVVDWSILPEKEPDAPTTHVFVSAVRKDYFSSISRALRESHQRLVVAENESIALARALLPDHLSCTALIDIGATTTNVAIFDDATLLPKVTLSIPIGDDAFTKAICDRQKVDTNEATRMKREEGFDTHKGEGWTVVILQERVQVIIHEIEKAFSHYELNNHKSIHRIILSGIGTLVPQIDTYIRVNLKRAIPIGDPLRDTSVECAIPKGKLPIFYADLLGLLARYRAGGTAGAHVNFATRWTEIRTPIALERGERFWRNSAIATFVISILLSGVLLYQTLLAPLARYERERAERTLPLAPFSTVEEVSDGTQTGTSSVDVPLTKPTSTRMR